MTAAQHEAMRRYREWKSADCVEQQHAVYGGTIGSAAVRAMEDTRTLADLAVSLFDETPITYEDMDTPNTTAAPFTGDDEDGYEVNRPILIRTRGQLAMLLEVLKGGGT